MIKKILFMNSISQDPSDRFFGWPTSLLYAIAPTIEAIKEGKLLLDYVPQIFDPIWYVEGVNSEDIKRKFQEEIESVDIICASATYDSLYPTVQLFSEAKKQNPRTITILGGPHFDETHNTILNDVNLNPQIIDFGIAGDGEDALKALLEIIAKESLSDFNPSNLPGEAWIYSTKGRYETSRKPINLDELPFMPIELVDEFRHKHDFDIFSDESGILPTIQMIAQRGCRYSCNFCSERKDLAYPNARSIDSILEEIELRKQQGFKAIFFDDSTLGLYPNIVELLKELEKTGMTFGSLNRFNHLTNQKIVEEYRKAGFKYVYCAIEQFDDNALKEMKKAQKVKQIAQSMEVLSQNGFIVGVSLLYGLPYESEDTITATLDFTQEWVERGVIRLISESLLSYHLATPIGKNKHLNFNRTPPNLGFPFNRFEEGQWYHSNHVTAPYLEKILEKSEARFKNQMIRNRHSWYAQQGYVIDANTKPQTSES